MSQNYIPFQFQPDTNSLNKQEFDKMMDDLRGRSMNFMEYLIFLKSMKDDDPLYGSIFSKLGRANLDKLRFKSEEKEILRLVDNPLLNSANYAKVMNFYKKYKDKYPTWANQNGFFFNDLKTKYNPQSN